MKKLLVIRNDKIGDFMLAWPGFAMLKASLPKCQITALVPGYTAPLAELCPWIDDVLIDPGKNSDKFAQKQLLDEVKQRQFDASISLFSTTYTAKLVWKAGIPYRLAPATKLAQIFYNNRIKQKRSQSAKPEYEYNLDLVRAFLADIGAAVVEPEAPYLTFSATELHAQKEKLAHSLMLDKGNPWVFVHAGSGGSANNLSLAQYSQLIGGLEGDFAVVLTAGPGEAEQAHQLKSLIERSNTQVAVYEKNDGIVDFTRSLACADLFIAGSTGPLHIAAALDIPTIGFFPAKRSATPLRWQPLNSQGRHLAFSPSNQGNKTEQEDMSKIDISSVLDKANPWMATFLS